MKKALIVIAIIAVAAIAYYVVQNKKPAEASRGTCRHHRSRACSHIEMRPRAAAPAANLDALIAAAKAEGELTTIALPHDWCGYGGLIEGFKAKYGLKVNELNPDAGSGDEIEAIKANKDNKGPQAPDVIDVGLAFGPSSKAEGLINRTRSRPGIRSPTAPRMPMATGMVTITACSPSK